MAELPRHPEADDQSAGAGHRSAGGTPWGAYAFVIIVAVVVLGMIVLHLTGVVGPGAHSQ